MIALDLVRIVGIPRWRSRRRPPGGIDAISAVETAPVVRAVKRAGAVLPLTLP